jgi:hypothetical protein
MVPRILKRQKKPSHDSLGKWHGAQERVLDYPIA